MPGAKTLFIVTNDNGCHIPLSHKFNADGYFRKRWGSNRGEDSVMEMFHRFIYRAHHGDIPEGYDVDHICRCRPCCNPQHLRALEATEHTIHTNKTRWLQ